MGDTGENNCRRPGNIIVVDHETLVSWFIDVLEISGNLSTRSRQILLSRLQKATPLVLEIEED